MRSTSRRLLILFILLLFGSAACSLPVVSAPTPFVFPTPNLTMTAIFNPPLEPNPTFTLLPPVHSATPSPTIDEGQNATAVPQNTEAPSETPTLELPTSAPTSTPVATQSNAGPGMRQGNSVAAIYFDTPPSIDGKLGDWGFDTYQIDNVVYGADRWRNPADLSGSLMVGWDEEYLYLGFRVKDDEYVQLASGELLFKGDSVEVLLDTDVSIDYYVRALSNDDYQLGISPGSPKPGKNTESYLWFPRSVEGKRSKVVIGVEKVDNGYRLETAIPWSIFGVTPEAGQHFGFAASISDNDRSGEAVQQSMVSNVPTRRLTDPTTWGDLTLVNP
jgi:hypothetical protein